MKTGRKPLDQTGKESAICAVRLPQAILKRLKAEAKRQKKSLSEYVRGLLEVSYGTD